MEIKIYVRTEEMSKAVQELAFACGYKWLHSGKNYQNYKNAHLIFDDISKLITWGDTLVDKQLMTLKEIEDFFQVLKLSNGTNAVIRDGAIVIGEMTFNRTVLKEMLNAIS